MRNRLTQLLVIALSLFMFSGCTIQKRKHLNGYYVSWHKTYNKSGSFDNSEESASVELTSSYVHPIDRDSLDTKSEKVESFTYDSAEKTLAPVADQGNSKRTKKKLQWPLTSRFYISAENVKDEQSLAQQKSSREFDLGLLGIMAGIFGSIYGLFVLFRKRMLDLAKWFKRNVRKTKYIIGASVVSVTALSMYAGYDMGAQGYTLGSNIMYAGVIGLIATITFYPRRNVLKLRMKAVHNLSRLTMTALIISSSMSAHYVGNKASELLSDTNQTELNSIDQSIDNSSVKTMSKFNESKSYAAPIGAYIWIVLLGIIMIAASCCIGCMIGLVGIGLIGLVAGWVVGIVVGVALIVLSCFGIRNMWRKARERDQNK